MIPLFCAAFRIVFIFPWVCFCLCIAFDRILQYSNVRFMCVSHWIQILFILVLVFATALEYRHNKQMMATKLFDTMERMHNLHCLLFVSLFWQNKQWREKKLHTLRECENKQYQYPIQISTQWTLYSTKYAIIAFNLSNCLEMKKYAQFLCIQCFFSLKFPLLLNLPLNCEAQFVQ